jgi:adenylosuccinate synthase
VRGWHSDIRGIRQFADLPREAQGYVERVEELVGVKVGWVANGPEREAVIAR